MRELRNRPRNRLSRIHLAAKIEWGFGDEDSLSKEKDRAAIFIRCCSSSSYMKPTTHLKQ
jgi:hypothetical protein